MSGHVPRRGSGPSRGLGVLLFAGLAMVAGAAAIPSGAFSTGEVPRATTVDVVQDENGVVGLDRAGSVRKNRIDRLVTVTNDFDTSRRIVVSLVGNDGDLYHDSDGDGTLENVGSSITLSLLVGESTDVYVEATGRPNTPIEYDITDSLSPGEDGTRFTIRRSAEITAGNGRGDPGR